MDDIRSCCLCCGSTIHNLLCVFHSGQPSPVVVGCNTSGIGGADIRGMGQTNIQNGVGVNLLKPEHSRLVLTI